MATIQETQQSTQSETARPLLVSVETLAEMLDISPRSVWRRLSSGEMIEPVRIGSSVRWRLRDVEAWVGAGCPTPVSEWNGR
ncbi:helix-turn-helix transcriptional regulator [Planctomicrobium sp. SH664]|uniref:helix-turn-helix transcriptional regulator n=1 Tax=Planctomicrobium sp. SH664 TaxID=3448125 RepID=UPI003F5BA4D0